MGYRQTEFPAKVIDFPIAQLDFSEQELIETFGAGVVPDPEPFTFPGPVKLWALVTDDGQHLVLEHHLGQEKITVLYAAPMDLTLALASLNIEKDRVVWEQTQEKINKFRTLHNVQF